MDKYQALVIGTFAGVFLTIGSFIFTAQITGIRFMAIPYGMKPICSFAPLKYQENIDVHYDR